MFASVALAVTAPGLLRNITTAHGRTDTDAFRALARLSRRIALLRRLHDLVAALLLRRLRALAARIAYAWLAAWRHAVRARRVALLAGIKPLVAALLRRRDNALASRIAHARFAALHARDPRRVALFRELHCAIATPGGRHHVFHATRALAWHINARGEAIFFAIIFLCLDNPVHAESLTDDLARADFLAMDAHAFVKDLSRAVLGKTRDAYERQRLVRVFWTVIAINAHSEQLDEELGHCRDRVNAGKQQENNEQHAQCLH